MKVYEVDKSMVTDPLAGLIASLCFNIKPYDLKEGVIDTSYASPKEGTYDKNGYPTDKVIDRFEELDGSYFMIEEDDD